ncbi:MAG: hypothetical protein ABI624_08990 [Casimicrobiaceae bacterium]
MQRKARWPNHGLIALAALATLIGGNAYAAESNKIHIRETKYGDFLGGKTCVPDLSRCEGTAKCLVPPKDYQCKTAAKPMEIQFQVIWDCGDNAHAAGHGAGPNTGKQTYTLTCPYVPNLNP